jgi:hypothetical protein
LNFSAGKVMAMPQPLASCAWRIDFQISQPIEAWTGIAGCGARDSDLRGKRRVWRGHLLEQHCALAHWSEIMSF